MFKKQKKEKKQKQKNKQKFFLQESLSLLIRIPKLPKTLKKKNFVNTSFFDQKRPFWFLVVFFFCCSFKGIYLSFWGRRGLEKKEKEKGGGEGESLFLFCVFLDFILFVFCFCFFFFFLDFLSCFG